MLHLFHACITISGHSLGSSVCLFYIEIGLQERVAVSLFLRLLHYACGRAGRKDEGDLLR